MKISIITAVFNREHTIARAIESIYNQSYDEVEHLVIDGSSTDNTVAVAHCASRGRSIILSEPDRGIYDALNKGIFISTGEIIGILHSDDRYADSNVLSEVASLFKNPDLMVAYGDAAFFRPDNPSTLFRRYRSNRFTPQKIAWGWMPSHTSIFFRKEVFATFGVYKTDYQIAADFEFIARIFKNANVRSTYINRVLIHMQSGGISTSGWRSTIRLNNEVLRACRENGIYSNVAMILSKYPLKALEYIFL